MKQHACNFTCNRLVQSSLTGRVSGGSHITTTRIHALFAVSFLSHANTKPLAQTFQAVDGDLRIYNLGAGTVQAGKHGVQFGTTQRQAERTHGERSRAVQRRAPRHCTQKQLRDPERLLLRAQPWARAASRGS